MRPEDVGVPKTDLVLGKHSGRHALRDRISDLGYHLNETQIEIIRTATPKRHYYVTGPSGCRLIDLQLGPIARAFAAAGSKEQIAQIARQLLSAIGAS